MESPKMQFSSECENRTDQCGSTKYPVSCIAVLGQQLKFSEFRGYLSRWYHVCTNAMVILKESHVCGEPKHVIF